MFCIVTIAVRIIVPTHACYYLLKFADFFVAELSTRNLYPISTKLRHISSVVAVPKFLLSVCFNRFFWEKPRFWIQFWFFDEGVIDSISTIFNIHNSNSGQLHKSSSPQNQHALL